MKSKRNKYKTCPYHIKCGVIYELYILFLCVNLVHQQIMVDAVHENNMSKLYTKTINDYMNVISID